MQCTADPDCEIQSFGNLTCSGCLCFCQKDVISSDINKCVRYVTLAGSSIRIHAYRCIDCMYD